MKQNSIFKKQAELSFNKNSREIIELTCLDPSLGDLFALIGEYSLVLRTDLFASLLRAIVGQQLSVKAAGTIWNRVVTLCSEISPAQVLSTGEDSLRNAGLSKQKILYLKDLSQKVLDKEIKLEELYFLEDIQVINTLTMVKGIGNWTAEMFLIFSLGRIDVFSLADAGLRRGIKWLYKLPDLPEGMALKEYADKWIPYRTVTSLYLWEAINRGLVKE